jgi:hypothetical protein
MRSMAVEAPGERLHGTIDSWAAQLDDLHEAALGDELQDIRRAIDRLESLFVVALGRFHKAGADGAHTSVQWLRWKCRLSPGAANQRLGLAQTLPDLPATEQAFARGEIGFQHASLISSLAQKVGAEEVRKSEPILLDAAARFDPHHFSMVVSRVRHCVDPDGALEEANQLHDKRYVHLSRSWEGLYFLDGRLDSEGGALLQNALGALMMPLPDDDRTPSQRRADALVGLARRSLDAGELPRTGSQRPHLTVTASLELLAKLPNQEPAHLEFGHPLPAESARRIACDASLTLMVLDGAGNPLDLGRTRRTIPPKLRKALVQRDKGCRFPGCDRPPSWTDGHHMHFWGNGGETSLANCLLLCWVHHRLVHEGGWRLVWKEGSQVHAIPPLLRRPLAQAA